MRGSLKLAVVGRGLGVRICARRIHHGNVSVL